MPLGGHRPAEDTVQVSEVHRSEPFFGLRFLTEAVEERGEDRWVEAPGVERSARPFGLKRDLVEPTRKREVREVGEEAPVFRLCGGMQIFVRSPTENHHP